jgi:hypothetical protein
VAGEEGIIARSRRRGLTQLDGRHRNFGNTSRWFRPTFICGSFPDNLPELYRNKIGRLAEALNARETVTEAADVMRGLIDRIVLTPAAGELRAELHGHLAVLARFAQEEECRSGANPARLSVVAGARNHREFPICVAL